MDKKKILTIDDEKDFTRILKMSLEKTGKYEVTTESESKNAFDLAKKLKPDLIFLDILMPGLNGFQVLDLLKKDKETVDIPVVMLTAALTDEIKTEVIKHLDKCSYMEKPVTISMLEDKIVKMLST